MIGTRNHVIDALAGRISPLSPPRRLSSFLLLFLLGALLWAAVLSLFLRVNPFHRLSASIATAYSVGLYLYLMGLTVWHWKKVECSTFQEMGLGFSCKPLANGLLLGLLMLFLLRGIELAAHLASFHPLKPSWLLLSNVLVALAFAASEEIVFRGLVLQTLLKGLGAEKALLASSALWSLAHFIKPGQGFPVLAALGLLIAGILLGKAYLATRSLWLPIGIHAGWVYFITVSGQLKLFGFSAGGSLFHGDGSPTSGLLGIALTALIALSFRLLLIDRKKTSA